MTTSSDPHLQPREVVKRWRNLISLGALANWRSAGKGPAYVKIGNRVMYRLADVEAWEAKNHINPATAKAVAKPAANGRESPRASR